MANFTTLVPGNPFFMENLTNNPVGEIKYSAADFRNYTNALHRRQGVLGATDFWVQQADNVGFAIKVLAGSAIVGKYTVVLPQDTTINLPFAQNPGTTCVHRVYLTVTDEAYDANSVGYEAHIQGMESVNGSVPPLPTFTAGYIELCTITYKTGQPNVQNKDIVNTRPHGGGGQPVTLTPSGGIVALANNAPRAAYHDGSVHLSGGVGRSSAPGYFIGSYKYTLTTLPGYLRPKDPVNLIGATSGVYTGIEVEEGWGPGPYAHRVAISPDGSVVSYLPPGGNPYHLYLHGLTYSLD